MKNTLFLLVCICLFNAICAQGGSNMSTVVVGPKKVVKANWFHSKFMGVGPNGDLYVRNCTAHTNNGVDFKYQDFMDKYNKDMVFVSAAEYKPGTGEDGVVNPTYQLVTLDGRSFSLSVADAPDKFTVSLVELQPLEWSIKSNLKTLAEIPKKKKGSYPGAWKLVLSPDKSKFAAINRRYDEEHKTNVWQATVFDASANMLWQGELPYTLEKNVRFKGNQPGLFDPILVDNDGGISALSAVRTDGQKQVIGASEDCSKVNWKLLRFGAGGTKVIDLNLEAGKRVFYPFITAGKSGVTVCGFYSGDGKSVEGAFSMAVGANDTKAGPASTKKFDADFFPNKFKDKRTTWDNWNLNLNTCESLSDGSVVLTAYQEFYNHQSTEHLNVTFELPMDEICMQISPGNEIRSLIKVPRESGFKGSEFMDNPLTSFIYNNNLYLLFLEASKDPNIPNLVLTKVNPDGSYKKETALAGTKEIKNFDFESLKRLNDNSFYMYAPPDVKPSGSVTYQLLKLTVN